MRRIAADRGEHVGIGKVRDAARVGCQKVHLRARGAIGFQEVRPDDEGPLLGTAHARNAHSKSEQKKKKKKRKTVVKKERHDLHMEYSPTVVR
jgi:hypothetical protein